MSLEKIVKNPVPMKIMMVVKNNQGKLVELRGVVRRMVVMKKKKIMSRLKKKEQTMMEMMKNQGKKNEGNGYGGNGGYKRKPRPCVNNLVEQEKKPNLSRVYKTASQRFSVYDT